MQKFLTGIREIHNVLIEHSDVYPRNMMVVDDDPERAIWIDFDRAQTFNASTLTERQQGWLDYEYEIVKDIMSRMVCSHFLPGITSLHSRTIGSRLPGGTDEPYGQTILLNPQLLKSSRIWKSFCA